MNYEFGILYLIPCPISDETAPWEVLPAANREVMDALDYFIVENTRSARRFLSKAGVARPIDTLEFRELNEHTAAGQEVEELVKPLLEGRSAGVISEAGVPGVADPGALVVEACHRRGIRVVPLVGPSSIILAVMNILPIPGLDGGHAIFTFWEMVTGRKVSDKVLEGAQYVGLIIILFLLLYANGNDIYRFFIK